MASIVWMTNEIRNYFVEGGIFFCPFFKSISPCGQAYIRVKSEITLNRPYYVILSVHLFQLTGIKLIVKHHINQRTLEVAWAERTLEPLRGQPCIIEASLVVSNLF